MQPTQAQINECARLKDYFPFRIIAGAFDTDGNWYTIAATTMAKANNAVRKGHSVFIFNYK